MNPSTSTDPTTLFRMRPDQPVVRLTRHDFSQEQSFTNNNNKIADTCRKSGLTPQKQKAPPESSATVNEEDADFVEDDFYLVSRTSAEVSSMMSKFNCLMKIYTDKNANFDVELTKLLQELMVNIVAPSDVSDPQKSLNFGRMALILQGSTTIYSKKVEFLSDLFSQFLLHLSSEIGKAATNADGAEETQAEKTTEAAKTGHKKKQSSNVATPFTLLDLKIKKNPVPISLRKIQLRPKIFPILFGNGQCDKDKQRVTALNQDLAGENTSYRVWAPVNESRGLLNQDCTDDVHNKFASSMAERGEIEPTVDIAERDVVMEPLDEGPPDDNIEPDRAEETADESEIAPNIEPNIGETEPPAPTIEEDPWQTLAPGDTIEDLVLQPQPPVPKFQSKIELEIDEQFYFKQWYKETKKTRGCFGDENVHEGLALEKEGKLLEHAKNDSKRKRIDIDSDRTGKKTAASLEAFLASTESDDEDVLGFCDDKPVYKNSVPDMPNVVGIEDWSLDPDFEDAPFEAPPADEQPSDVTTNEDEPTDDTLGLAVPAEDAKNAAARVDGFISFMKQQFVENEKKKKFSFQTFCDSILGAFPPSCNVVEPESQPRLGFHELLDQVSTGQDQDIARQLLATLMLANRQNVEIEGFEEGVLANDSLSIKLLNRSKQSLNFEEDDQYNS
ncbi:condensin-2 complex subunit H2-like [Neocloeon triangulifer]|uniref:condensin-2 complex subunit H2-like n=1 Tax=Neocloeon triangulifer TaxID=2078957 RepID=UPI00286F424A|nr:condensin-2 complex subunit H2-like [Neocloeon triangulifer]